MSGLLIVWLLIAAALLFFVAPRPGTGGPLTLAYFVGLSILHVPGALSYVGNAAVDTALDATRVGFEITLIGMAAFVAGAAITRGRQPMPAWHWRPDPGGGVVLQLGTRFLVIGLFAYFFATPLASFIPSLTSIVATLSVLLVIGLWLRLYASLTMGNRRGLWLTIAILPLMPLATLVNGGFVGFGVSWTIAVVALLFILVRRRVLFLLMIPVVVFLGLSFFTTYSSHRNDIRDVVWRSQSSLMTRVSTVADMVVAFKPINLDNDRDVSALRARLNQNSLVGYGVIRHRDGMVSLVYGETFQPWLLIPRALWPGKPDVGGSGAIVTNFTGIGFAVGTSVGAGQVLEFYYNFGTVGVILGFFGLGYLLRFLDRKLMTGLVRGDLRMVLLNGMPGLALLQPGGSVIETSIAAIAALVAAHLVLAYDRYRRGTRTRRRTGRVALPPVSSRQRLP